MSDPKSRARVERLLRGDFRADDLTGLFLFARDHCDGRETVAEIGHFVAHHTERNKGIVTRSTRNWFTVARYHMWAFNPINKQVPHHGRLPPAARDYFKIAVPRIGAKLITKETGIRGPKAHEMMLDLADRLTQNQDGTWALPAGTTPKEIELAERVSSLLVVIPAFESGRLIEEFGATLRSNGLISKDEWRESAPALGVLLQLYAVSAMHNCVVQVGDGTITQLKGTADAFGKKIHVSAAVPVYPENPAILVSSDMFTVNIDPAVHCHADLLTREKWDFEIELAPDRRLSPLR